MELVHPMNHTDGLGYTGRLLGLAGIARRDGRAVAGTPPHRRGQRR